MTSVLQDWVMDLTFMQQSVLLTSLRAPDGLEKNHPVKVLMRWLRRCILLSAFDGRVLTDPYEAGGGSFTGPCIANSYAIGQESGLDYAKRLYFDKVDEVPHHFQLHFMHAAEILGWKHPDSSHRHWWHKLYLSIVHDIHLWPETEEQMDLRLGDVREQWLARDEFFAR